MRRFLSFLVIYAIVIFTLHLWLDYDYPAEVEAQSGRTFYIDFSSGSNSQDGTEKTHTTGITGPWKSAPGMPTASGCTTTGSGPSYVHQAGDQFIFKGGVTWPAACFTMFLNFSGAPGSQLYYGTCVNNTDFAAAYPKMPLSANLSPCATGTSWPSSGWTRPLWDMNHAVIQNVVYANSSVTGYLTFDNIEIAHQGIPLVAGEDQAAFFLFYGHTGTILSNMYIHDWTTTGRVHVSTNPSDPNQNIGYDDGAVFNNVNFRGSNVTLQNSTISDQNGWFFTSTGAQVFGGWGGACMECDVVSGTTFHDLSAACFDVTISCHDSEFYNMDKVEIGNYDGGTNGIHTQVIEDDGNNGGLQVYNDLIHDTYGGVAMLLCDGDQVYNNVGWNQFNTGNGILTIGGGCFTSNSSLTTRIVNNTFDCSGSGGGGMICLRFGPPGDNIPGTVVLQNNIWITNGTPTIQQVTIGTLTGTPNFLMSTSEASTYGFTVANLYKPSSPDPNVSGKGVNLTSSCSGLAALCQDTSGAPWFGGSYIARGSSWDMGAFKGLGGTTGPPTLSITSPSPGTISGSVNLQSTCTPQGTATCTSVQYSIDGFTFGAAQTTSPYTLVWNTGTAANANHVISAVATDSNGNTGSASSTVTVTVSNSIPGCFVSNANFSTNQSFTPQTTGTQTYTFTVTPNTAGNAGDTAQDTPIGLSQVAATGYSQFAAIVRASTNNVWDAYDGSVPGYHALNSAPYTPGTAYIFSMTPNLSASPQTYNLSETSPSSIVIATNFQLRLAVTSLGFINANSSNNSTPDTVKVCGFQAGSGTSLSFNPPSLNFGNVNSGSNASLSVTVTSANGSTSFTSVTVAGTGFTKTADTCSTNTVASCSFTVQFAPSSTGNFSGTATLVDSATGSPQVVNLTGTGTATASSATPSPTSLNFGNVQLGLAGGATSGPITVTLMNGPVTFAATPITFSNPDFSVAANTCVGSVSASSCQITPRFIPSSLSNETATMTINDDAPTSGSTQTVALTGTGVNYPVISPSVNFVWNGTLPIQVTVKGKTYSLPYPETCNCQWDNSKWSCACN